MARDFYGRPEREARGGAAWQIELSDGSKIVLPRDEATAFAQFCQAAMLLGSSLPEAEQWALEKLEELRRARRIGQS